MTRIHSTILAAALATAGMTGVAASEEAMKSQEPAAPTWGAAYSSRATTQKDIDTAKAADEGRPAPQDETMPLNQTASYSPRATTKKDGEMIEKNEMAAEQQKKMQ